MHFLDLLEICYSQPQIGERIKLLPRPLPSPSEDNNMLKRKGSDDEDEEKEEVCPFSRCFWTFDMLSCCEHSDVWIMEDHVCRFEVQDRDS